ncbi:uncharacterized protein LOC141679766 [Apium graveolens]|uniref:uncharacterized protein LOC141679766 n=1 Tax=Apium graveolens TaxID=4045 RepID=UPI003D7A63EA
MNVLSWNCRGVGRPRKVQFLFNIVRQEQPYLVFLCETIAVKSKLEYVQNKLGYEGLFVVDPVGRSGGIALLWKEKEQVDILGFSQHHIDARVKGDNTIEWRLTGVYGEPDRLQRHKTWDLLRNLARDANLPWCVIGDINNVMCLEEKVGGDPYPTWLMEGFSAALQDAGLTDLPLTGHQFTWERNRGKIDWMEVRLDRALITDDWVNSFPLAKLYNLEGAPSDHSALLLVPQTKLRRQKPYRFKFENAWNTEPMCELLVRDGWESNPLLNVQEKIKICGESLSIWGKEITGNFSGRIKECKKELKRFRGGKDAWTIGKYAEARERLNLIYNQREVFWRQRSKQLWLSAGDKNSRYFHRVASQRRRTNTIQRLQVEEGQWVDWENGLEEFMKEYYSGIFKATEANWQEVIDCVPRKITSDKNSELLAEVVDEEVKTALFQMDPDKAPGPDGMTPGFFSKTLENCWQ